MKVTALFVMLITNIFSQQTISGVILALDTLEKIPLKAADVNTDESVTADDALNILKYVVKLMDISPVSNGEY